MNNTPRSNRIHIGLFGRRNAGKSSLINALTNQKISLVSDVPGTTTDPVFKAMEILPLGPCVIIDTAGIDDIGSLGEMRIKRTLEVIPKTDVGLVVIPAGQTKLDEEEMLIKEFKKRKKPYIIVINKVDEHDPIAYDHIFKNDIIRYVSAKTKEGIHDLKETIGKSLKVDDSRFHIVADLINPGDIVVLVTPIDSAAPKGRLILPQQQVVRDILDHDAICFVTKEFQLRQTLESLKEKPALVITDSQAFEMVSEITPEDVPLTSFSILFARHKGDLEELIRGVEAIKSLENGDKVLISEGCTHHRQKDDIGTVKIPKWLKEYTGKDLEFIYSSGYTFPEIEGIKMVIHCGACMLNRNEMLNRIEQAKERNLPIVNYGVFISYVHGIFDRALKPIPEARKIYETIKQ